MSRYIDAEQVLPWYKKAFAGKIEQNDCRFSMNDIDCNLLNIPTADVRDYATAHKLVGGGERDGATCWFECDNCGLSVDIGDVFCKHCGARFVP